MILHKTIASVFGVGFIKGGGTIAAIIYCIVWWLLPVSLLNNWWQAVIVLAITVVGTLSSCEVDKVWGKDSSRVVIDEVAGMSIALLFAPHQMLYLAAGLVAFRFFDIVKPLGVRKMEKLPTGIGVMADDILAGIYAFVFVKIVMLVHLYLLMKK
ncbi:MAG: phosphatidylglycerophosphatase A [Ferruginibacter sp.]